MKVVSIVFSKPKNTRYEPIANEPANVSNQASFHDHTHAPDDISDSIVEPQDTVCPMLRGMNEQRVDFGITQENPVLHFQTSQGSNHFRIDSHRLGLQPGQSLFDQRRIA